MAKGRFGEIIPTDNIYVVKSAADLPDILSPWVIYNLTYKSGMFYTPDGVNLRPVGAGIDEALIYFLGE